MGDDATSKMTSSEKGRIDQAEQAIVGLSGRMDGFDTRLEVVEADTSETKKGVQILLSRTGGMEATRGMIPVGSLLAVIAIILTLVGIGLKLQFDAEQKHNAKIDKVVELEDARHETVAANLASIDDRLSDDDIRERDDKAEFKKHAIALENHEGRISHMEEELRQHWEMQEKFLPLWGAVQHRVLSLEAEQPVHRDINSAFIRVQTLVEQLDSANVPERLATVEAAAQKAWDEIADHEDEADHPLMQTEAIKHLERRLEGIPAAAELEILREQLKSLNGTINQLRPR